MASSLLSTTTLLSLLSLLFVLSNSASCEAATQIQRKSILLSRKILSSTDEEDQPLPEKKKTNTTTTTTTVDTKKKEITLLKPIKMKKTNTTITGKLISSTLSKTHQNKTLNSISKSPKPSNSTKVLKPIKLNSTSTSTTKKINLKPLTTTTTTKITKKNATITKIQQPTTAKPKQQQQQQRQQKPKSKSLPKPVKIRPWLDETNLADSDLIAEFRDLPSKFHQTLLPDLEHLSTKSKAYLTLANKEFTNSFKPIVGRRYASTIASLASAAFLLLPLALVTLLFHHLRHFLSLQKILLSVQIYLAIYFFILSLTALLTGFEPLRLFYATSPGSYVYTQVLQTLGYVLYLLLQLMNLVVVFSGDGGGLGSRALGLAQVVVGLAVGLHYYAAVFHRAVLGEPPKTNWKIHAVYASCFVVICAFARAERRKKAYLHGGGGDDGKKS